MSFNGNGHGNSGPPPFRPPPSNLPPFPPNMNGNRPPPAFPPFRPNHQGGAGFVPPPFPPKFPPGINPPSGPNFPRSPMNPVGLPSPIPSHPQPMSPSPGLGPGGMPFRPPPSGPGGHHLTHHNPNFSPRPGIGLPSLPPGLPQPPNFAQQNHPHQQQASPGAASASPGAKKGEVKTTKVFIGGIAPGITDKTLTELLNACGPLHELKRVMGVGGRPQAFGFASFESPEVVLRCIRCLNGVELPDMTPEGRRDKNPPKPLVVKADEKTAAFLKEFEETLGRTDADENEDAACRRTIAHIVALLLDPNAVDPNTEKRSGGLSPINVVVPAHLQDLKEGDLPENQRVAVLDQIAIFRESAARREKEKKMKDEESERARAIQLAQGKGLPSNLVEYGYGNRAFNKQAQKGGKGWGGAQQSPENGPGTAGHGGARTGAMGGRDPQGYSEPVAFVRPESMEGKGENERTDEEEEELRRARRKRDQEAALRDREKRVENRERQRLDNLSREMASRKQQADSEERARRHDSEMLEMWDDDEKEERGRELFYTDRARWRQQRQQARAREYQDDLRDRQLEQEELKALEKESEEFLQRQLAEMAEIEEKQRRAGLLTEDAAPIKLALSVAVPVPDPKSESVKPEPSKSAGVGGGVKPRVAVNFGDDEDEDEIARRARRTFVKLEYDEKADAETRARRNAKLLEIRKEVPVEKSKVFSASVEWAAFIELRIRNKIQDFVRNKITEAMGELDEDLADFVMEQVRDQKGPEELIDGLEPVLAEEAESFTLQLWRQLLFESRAYVTGIDSGTMMA